MEFPGKFDEATVEVVQVGIDRYFAEDYVSALHILVPQLEDAIRRILAILGVATTSFRDGVTQEKTLDSVLSTAELRQTLGEDLTTYLQYLLVGQRADNLRNKVAHGLVKKPGCSREVTQQILHCYVLLANFAVTGPENLPRASTPSGRE
ncbi:MAG TPA: DUF4209 domain-containing protein [Chloroflexota bacterium]